MSFYAAQEKNEEEEAADLLPSPAAVDGAVKLDLNNVPEEQRAVIRQRLSKAAQRPTMADVYKGE